MEQIAIKAWKMFEEMIEFQLPEREKCVPKTRLINKDYKFILYSGFILPKR